MMETAPPRIRDRPGGNSVIRTNFCGFGRLEVGTGAAKDTRGRQRHGAEGRAALQRVKAIETQVCVLTVALSRDITCLV